MLYGIGYTTVPVMAGPLFRVRNTAIEAPSNYKDPIKIKEYIDRTKERRMAEACQTNMMCLLDRIWIQNTRGQVLNYISIAEEGKSSLEILKELVPAEDLRDCDSGVEFAVINTSLFANLLLRDHLGRGLSLDASDSWLFRNRLGDPLFPVKRTPPFVIFDPIPALTGTTIFSEHVLEVAQEFGFKDNAEFKEEERMALIALHLGKVMGRE
jgi:hypothetical protein